MVVQRSKVLLLAGDGLPPAGEMKECGDESQEEIDRGAGEEQSGPATGGTPQEWAQRRWRGHPMEGAS